VELYNVLGKFGKIGFVVVVVVKDGDIDRKKVDIEPMEIICRRET
jgi:hypothetical protein